MTGPERPGHRGPWRPKRGHGVRMARRAGRPVDTGNAPGGRLPRGPNPRTSLARRLPRSPCAAPHVRLRTEGFFHLRGPRRGHQDPTRARPQARKTHSKVVTTVTDGKAARPASTPGRPSPQHPSPADLAATVRPSGPVEVTGAQSLVRSLECVGVDTIFGIPGGAILPAYDPLMDSTKVRHILVRHEQGAGHAAEGYASATGKVGVCMATSGPGATNLVTPIANAYMDSVPMVAITGQVSSSSIGTDAFQEADIRGITMPITKHNYLVTDPAQIPRAIAEAFHIASTGRPGPVLVDISKDALQATHHVLVAAEDRPARLPPGRPAAQQADPRGGPADRAGPSPRAVRRWRHHPLRRQRPAAPLRRADPDPGGDDADGPRRRARTATRSTSACPACTAPSRRSRPCRSPTCWSPSARGSTTASPASCRRSRRRPR